MRIVVLDLKTLMGEKLMKDFDILTRRVELLEQKVQALEWEHCSPDCSPGETCEPSDDECCEERACDPGIEPCEVRCTGAGNPDDRPEGE